MLFENIREIIVQTCEQLSSKGITECNRQAQEVSVRLDQQGIRHDLVVADFPDEINATYMSEHGILFPIFGQGLNYAVSLSYKDV